MPDIVPSPPANTCNICGNANNNRLHEAREMAFGLRDKFTYLECGNCGCLQLLNIPADMSRYYPGNYYSLQTHGKLMTFIRHQWAAYGYYGRNIIGRIFSSFFYEPYAMQAIRRANVPKTARVLDVGCGSGRLLLDMRHLGFANLFGADPFVAKDIYYENGPTVFKREIAEVDGKYDLIMFNYSFEHMDRQTEILSEVRRLLAPQGKVIVRIPVASSYGWRHYGVNWFGLDAPRHFYLHTFKSMELLAKNCGLVIESTVQEGSHATIWLSEMYVRDIAGNDPEAISASRPLKWLPSLLTGKIRKAKAKAAELNRQNDGDMVSFRLGNAP
jgi:2-polyprenyl-3-methyl-5-hydroxy-6-metoxy-1,4-benzoquinol methylase